MAPYPPGLVASNQVRNRGAGYRLIGTRPVRSQLAVVGGSPSLDSHLDTLRRWNGEIWAVNATFRYLRDHGIDSTFFTIDASDIIAEWAAGASRAVLADTVSEPVFEALKDADIELALLGDGGLPHGCTSAITAASIAAERGHKHITYFGCESSFTDKTHAYRDETPDRILVACGGETFSTCPGFMMQALGLAELAQECPGFVTVAEGGLLPVLARCGEYEVTHISQSLLENQT